MATVSDSKARMSGAASKVGDIATRGTTKGNQGVAAGKTRASPKAGAVAAAPTAFAGIKSPQSRVFTRASKAFGALGNPECAKLLWWMAQAKGGSSGYSAEMLGTVSGISEGIGTYLAALKSAGLIESTGRGTAATYAVSDLGRTFAGCIGAT